MSKGPWKNKADVNKESGVALLDADEFEGSEETPEPEAMVPLSRVQDIVRAEVDKAMAASGKLVPVEILDANPVDESNRARLSDAMVDQFLNKKPNLAKYYIVETARCIVQCHELVSEAWENVDGRGRERVRLQVDADFISNPNPIGLDLKIADPATKLLKPVTIFSCDLSLSSGVRKTRQDIIDLNLECEERDADMPLAEGARDDKTPIKTACYLMERRPEYLTGLETKHTGRIWREDRLIRWLKFKYKQIRQTRAAEDEADADWMNANPAQRAIGAF